MKFIDTHAHLDYFAKDGILNDAIERATVAGVDKIITCSTIPDDWQLYKDISDNYPNVFWQIGIHPTEIKEEFFDALDALPSYFCDEKSPVAIGEIGLDFYRLAKNSAETEQIIKTQKKFFRRQLDFARDLNLKVCVHARDSIDECIEEISSARLDFSNVVFHCFSGSVCQLEKLNKLGARASFTGIITYKSAGEMRDAMLKQGLEKIMFETDCPYLAPVPMRGKTNEPAFLPLTAKAAANIFGISENEMSEISRKNSRDFFNI